MTLSAPRPRATAVADVVGRHQAALRSYLRWLGADADAVDDLVQDTFVAALSRPFEPRSHAEAGGWLRTVARRLLLRRLRADGRRARTVRLDEDAAAWERHLGADGGGSFREALRRCLRELKPRHGDAVRLRYGEGLPVAVVGERLGIGAAGAESMLRRLRALLRACIEREGER